MGKIVQSIFEAGIFPELDEWEKRSIRLLNRLIFIAVVGTFCFMMVDVFNGYYEVVFVLFAVVLVGAGEQVLVRKRQYNPAKLLVFFFILIYSVIFSVVVGNKSNPEYMILPLAMMPLLVFKSIRLSVILFALTVLAFALAIYLQMRIPPLLILADHLVMPYTFLAAFLMMTIIFLLTLYSRSLTSQYEKIIVEKNEQLTYAYKDIKDSIVYAKRLQEAILPSEKFINEHLPENFIFYKPKDIVAGDFYWFHVIQNGMSEPQIFFAAADCTGHGVPGAMVSVVCSNALNRAVVELEITEPGKILDKVREIVIDTFGARREEVKDGMDISLVSIVRNGSNILVKWAGANNPLWFMREGKFQEIKPDKQPIGSYENPKPFTTHSLDLSKGDTLFLFTDGYADQFGGPKGKKFKYKQLAELLEKNASLTMPQQKEKLERSFEAWRGNNEQVDDVCIIGVRI